MNKIYINKPSITDLEITYVNDAIKNGWAEKCYDYINKFEQSFSTYLNSRYALATSSCTGAIHLALMALGVKPGDEVIVPEITWIASVEPVLYIGARPVFVDVLPDTWCIDPAKIEEAITPRTKAIIAVHIYGNVCDMDSIMAIAKKHNLKVLEDAAEGIGSELHGQKVGSIGDAGVFSFHGTKTITTGEGGILVTDNEEVYEKAKILNDHGRNPRDPDNKMFWMRDYGYKYKISNLSAALGCAQVERLDELIIRKRQIFDLYYQELKSLPCSFNQTVRDSVSGYWLPTIIFNNDFEFDREKLFSYHKSLNIDSRPFFYPLSSLPMFESKKENKVAYSIYNKGINLPSYHDLKDDQVLFVAATIKKFING